jgi:hypothetical protein
MAAGGCYQNTVLEIAQINLAAIAPQDQSKCDQ